MITIHICYTKDTQQTAVRRLNASSGNRTRGNRLEGDYVTTTPMTQSGDDGYRSRCLVHAKHALYHLSYTPLYVQVEIFKFQLKIFKNEIFNVKNRNYTMITKVCPIEECEICFENIPIILSANK